MKNKSMKHWLVMVVCCGMAAASIGVSINSSGVFYSPVATSLGVLRGNFALHMTIFLISSALGSLMVTSILKKVSFKLMLVIAVGVIVGATALMALATNLLMFYILGAIRGFAAAMFSIVSLSIIINNWFEARHGTVTSIVFGFSGLSGALFSPIIASVIEKWGWQVGYLAMAGFILALCLPAIIYPFHLDPKKDGLVAYGHEENSQHKMDVEDFKFNFKAGYFWTFIVFGVICSSITSVTQHLPGYSTSLGFSLETGAALLSAGMIGNIISKIILGLLSDKIGALKATLAMLAFNTLGIVLLILGSSTMLLTGGAFMLGFSYAVGAVGLPLLTKYYFGLEMMADVFPKISFASSIGASISLTLVGYVYDYFGSYLYAFYIALVLIVIALVALMVTTLLVKRVNA